MRKQPPSVFGQLLRQLSTALFHAQRLDVNAVQIALVRIDNLARHTAVALATPRAPKIDLVLAQEPPDILDVKIAQGVG